mgnify:CR=1 FL=1
MQVNPKRNSELPGSSDPFMSPPSRVIRFKHTTGVALRLAVLGCIGSWLFLQVGGASRGGFASISPAGQQSAIPFPHAPGWRRHQLSKWHDCGGGVIWLGRSVTELSYEHIICKTCTSSIAWCDISDEHLSTWWYFLWPVLYWNLHFPAVLDVFGPQSWYRPLDSDAFHLMGLFQVIGASLRSETDR